MSNPKFRVGHRTGLEFISLLLEEMRKCEVTSPSVPDAFFTEFSTDDGEWYRVDVDGDGGYRTAWAELSVYRGEAHHDGGNPYTLQAMASSPIVRWHLDEVVVDLTKTDEYHAKLREIAQNIVHVLTT